MERVRAMLMDGPNHLPKHMWAELIITAAYIKNRSPASGLPKTPYELWHNKKPDLSNLHIIGCTAYAHTLKQGRKKLTPHSKRYLLVGYEGHSIYRLWDPIANTVI